MSVEAELSDLSDMDDYIINEPEEVKSKANAKRKGTDTSAASPNTAAKKARNGASPRKFTADASGLRQPSTCNDEEWRTITKLRNDGLTYKDIEGKIGVLAANGGLANAHSRWLAKNYSWTDEDTEKLKVFFNKSVKEAAETLGIPKTAIIKKSGLKERGLL